MIYLNGSDMKCTLFIEDNEHNQSQIQALRKAIRIMGSVLSGGIDVTDKIRITDNQLNSFFRSPLARFYCRNAGHYDTDKTYILRGDITLPELRMGAPQTLADSWEESVLECTKYPKWNAICNSVEEVKFRLDIV